MSVTQADQTLRELEAVRRQTRRRLEGMAYPLVLFGSLSLIAAVVSALFGPGAQALFWAIAAPIGGVAVGACGVRVGRL